MKVRELIRALGSFPSEMEVLVTETQPDGTVLGHTVSGVDVIDGGQIAYITLTLGEFEP